MFVRNCPKCDEIIKYTNKYNLFYAERDNRLCSSCKNKRPMSEKQKRVLSKKAKNKYKNPKNHPMYGKSVYNIWLEKYGKEEADKREIKKNKKIGIKSVGRSYYSIWLEKYGKEEADKRQQISNKKNKNNQPDNTGENNPMYNRCNYDVWIEKYGKREADKRQEEMNKKKRLSHIKNVEIKKLNGNQLKPNYNPSAIPIIESVADSMGITDLQHAENGGEFYIKELGYWVDGYSSSKNIVIEYYEPWHKKQIKRDKKRKREIIDFLECKFIEIEE